jgi:quinoprotein dehydrogenase-associated probable ABC transporter substrate-binding protein
MSPRTALVAAALVLALPAAVAAQELRPHTLESGVVRICADPDNLPASNDKGEGYENRIAELLAKTWNAKLEYAWWPVRRGYFGRALNGRYCDIALTAPAGLDMAGVTKPYYRSAYVIVTRKDSGLDLTSLADPRFKTLKIGVHLLNSDAENTPPAMALSKFGVVGNLVGFNTFFSAEGDRPEDIFRALADRRIDVAVVWGPLAGYFAERVGTPLVIRPVAEKEVDGIPFAFSLGMATRRRERGLRDSLQTFIDQNQGAISGILKEFGVPVIPEEPAAGGQAGASR